MKPALAACAILVAACASSPDGDVTGPFTGETHRYVIDSFSFPHNNGEARAVAADLDGDKLDDNQLGQVLSTLRYYNDITDHGADMIAAGIIASSVEIVADDPLNDDSVSVRYIGADGAPSTVIGGRLVNGAFHSNRTRDTRYAGAAELHLPVFPDIDPTILPIIGLEAELDVNADGSYSATFRGGIPHDVVTSVASTDLAAMINANPASHLIMFSMFDTPPHDHIVTPQEIADSSIFISLLGADVTLNNQPVTSFAFSVHLTACDEGTCAAPTFDHCFDRTLDGDETDVDCGGSCRGCRGDAACTQPSDCESNGCTAGQCAAPSCSDGVRDGFETDVDCGSDCAACARNKKCVDDEDCVTGQCGAPVTCNPEDLFCVDLPEYSYCQ